MLKFNLTDLDELLENVRLSHSKSYIQEAIISYRSGAYRSSIIATWIAICVDIIEKIRELDATNDKAANELNLKLQNIHEQNVPAMQNFEKEILEYAYSKLQLISLIEKKHLERIRDDRSICAHPTFSSDGSQFHPSSELARTYIVQACSYLLIHPPTMGKSLICRLENFICEASFPTDEEGAFIVLSSKIWLGRARESTIKNILTVILKKLFRCEDKIKFEISYKYFAAIGAIKRIAPDIYDDVMSEKFNTFLELANDSILKRAFVFIDRLEESWKYLSNATIMRMQCLIKDVNSFDIIKYSIVSTSYKHNDLTTYFQDKFLSLSKIDKYNLLRNIHHPSLIYYAIEIFLDSNSFDSAYKCGNDILIPYSAYLTDRQLESLLTNIINLKKHKVNQILHASNIDQVFLNLFLITNHNIQDASQLWVNFWNSLGELKLQDSYPKFKEILIEENLIQDTMQDILDSYEDCPF